MKQMAVYIVGTLLLMPCVLIFTENVLVDLCALIYTLAVVCSSKWSDNAKRFWRIWHRENFRILSIIKQKGN